MERRIEERSRAMTTFEYSKAFCVLSKKIYRSESLDALNLPIFQYPEEEVKITLSLPNGKEINLPPLHKSTKEVNEERLYHNIMAMKAQYDSLRKAPDDSTLTIEKYTPNSQSKIEFEKIEGIWELNYVFSPEEDIERDEDYFIDLSQFER